MQPDSEERQRRALNAMDGLEMLLDCIPQDDMIEVRYIATLVSLTYDAARDAIPKASGLLGSND